MTASLSIDLVGIAKRFRQAGQSIEVLQDVNLHLAAGATAAIIGQSGSGKSTLLGLLAGLDRPSAGQILLGGQDLARLSESELAVFRARHVGIVFQQFHLMAHLNALENVSLPLELAGDDRAMLSAREALASVGLSERQRHFPSQLSGGERQRVAIARALVCKPQVLLADEPSGSLDATTGREVMNLLFDLVRDRQTTFVLVTHNDELAARCERRYLLDQGRLSEAGPVRG